MRSQGWAQPLRVIHIVSLPQYIKYLWCSPETLKVTALWIQCSYMRSHTHVLFMGVFMYYVSCACASYINIQIYSCSIRALPASWWFHVCRHHIKSCVCSWCSRWGIHPAVNREHSAPSLPPHAPPPFLFLSLSLCLSIFLSVLLTAVCIQCHTAAAVWYEQVGGPASSVLPLKKNDETSSWSCCSRGGFGFQSPALHNLSPVLGLITKTKEGRRWKTRRRGERDALQRKGRERAILGLKGVWKIIDLEKKKKRGRSWMAEEVWEEKGRQGVDTGSRR